MSPLLPLLLFCDFLENRLHTSSLALLRRFFSDFFAGNEQTLLDFVRLGASIVTVIPVERTSLSHQEEATRLLNQQLHMMVNYHQQHSQLYVFHYLSVRVATRNIFWLRDMFLDFCDGSDSLLREFVHWGSEAISVIPTALQMNPRQPMPSVVHASVFPPLSTAHLMLHHSPEQPQEEHNQLVEAVGNGEESSDESDSDDGSEINSMEELVNVSSLPPSLANTKTCILGVLERLEEQQPWKQVFNPETLPLPFTRAKHPKLAAALKNFWTQHAREVWERRFWGPLIGIRDNTLYENRKFRQAKARKAFEGVMTQAFQELGASFFASLDRRTKPHRGWWYVEPVQDLVLIAQRTDLKTCLNYLETQALERFTTVPDVGINPRKSNNGKSRSMWSVSKSMEPILSEICALAAKKPPKIGSKK